ncbi:rod shape-determining protein, partial [Clostridium perfringens]|uniref:rod shape-determining protein n=1 Tax=Clostridium perfringens TaxID=1502 RepID=UPI002AC6196A
VVVRSSIKVAGDSFDDAIIKYVRNKYKIMIGEKTAEELKVNIGSAFNGSRNLTAMMKGRNLITGLPDEVSITSEEIIYALKESVSLIVDNVKFVLEKTPPELAADIIEKGILMTGGGALLDGLDKLIEHETGVNVDVANNSVEAVAEGTGKVLGYLD